MLKNTTYKEVKPMKKVKRIIALLPVVAIIICALLTLIFALLDYQTAWKASAYCMVVIPVLLYAMLLIYNILKGRGAK